MGDKLLSKILGHGIISVHVCHFDDISENSNLFSLGECLILIHGGGWWKMKIEAMGHRHFGLSAIKTLQRFDSVKDNEWTWRLDLYPIMTYKQTGPIFIWNIKQTHWVVIQPINFHSPIHSAKRFYFEQSLAARPSRPCSLASSAAFLPWHLRTNKPLKPPDQPLNLQKDTEI